MGEHEWRRGGPALAPVKVALDQGGCIGVRVETLTGLTRYFDPSDLIPDDRHRTPIAPEDVREGDVVRMEWEGDGVTVAVEGPARWDENGFGVDLAGGFYHGRERRLYLLSRKPTERDKWWPPQPGDTISDGVGRVMRGTDDRWHRLPDHPDYRYDLGLITDADVPDDAVLVLPAQTREATS